MNSGKEVRSQISEIRGEKVTGDGEEEVSFQIAEVRWKNVTGNRKSKTRREIKILLFQDLS